MSRSPCVSIIINNYNYAEYVAEAIASAVNQTYANTEVIVVDDGSTDHSRDVIAKSEGDFVTVHKENEGQASAFNRGFERCQGDVVIFLDADDILKPTAAEFAIASLRESGAIKVHWHLEEIDAQGIPTGRRRPRKPLPAGNFLEKVLELGPCCFKQPPTSGNAWSREFLTEVMPIHQLEDKHGADGVLRRLAPIYGEIGIVNSPQAYYRVHNGNFSGHDKGLALKILLKRFPVYLDVAGEHLAAKGYTIDHTRWYGDGSAFMLVKRAADLHERLLKTIPKGDTFLLMDDGEFGETFFTDRKVIPFPHLHDDAPHDHSGEMSLMEAFKHQAANGATWFVLAFTAFSSREMYPGFFRHLECHGRRVHDDECALVYELVGSHSVRSPENGCTGGSSPCTTAE